LLNVKLLVRHVTSRLYNVNTIVLEYILLHYINIESKRERNALPEAIKSQNLVAKNYSQNTLFINASRLIYE